MSLILKLSFIITLAWPQPYAAAKSLQPKLKIALLDSGANSDHETQVQNIILQNVDKSVQIVSFPIYSKSGNLTPDQFLKSIKLAVQENAKILHLSWNMKYKAGFQPIVELLNTLSDKNMLVVAASGSHYPPLRLQDTVMGQVKDALIIGELDKNGNLVPRNNYGDELLTAIKPPKSLKGSSFSAALFTAQLANKSLTQPLNAMHLKRDIKIPRFPSLKELIK